MQQILKFASIGAVATACHYAVLIGAVELGLFGAVSASGLGALTGAVVSYVLNRRITFASAKAHRIAVPRFFLIAAVALAGNVLLMAWFVGLWGWPYLIAQAVTTGLLLILTFTANKYWTFR